MSVNGVNGFGQPNGLWAGSSYSPGYFQGSNIQSPYRVGNLRSGMANSNAPQINNVLQVMGVESAKEFKVGPNSQAILMDLNRPVFYLKSSDDSGYSAIKAYEFHEISLDPSKGSDTVEASDQYISKDEFEQLKSAMSNNEYVTKAEFEEFKKMIEDLVVNNG